MRTMYKYILELRDVQHIMMPKGSIPLSVGLQGDAIVLWALVIEGVTSESRRVRIVGTGNPADDVSSSEYVGTVQQQFSGSRQLVWHVFVS